MAREASAFAAPELLAAAGPSQPLLKSNSTDSVAGLVSPGVLTPERQSSWQPPDPVFSQPSSPLAVTSTPFANAAHQAVIGDAAASSSRVYHSLMRTGAIQRRVPAVSIAGAHDPAAEWMSQRLLLSVWLVTGIVTVVASLWWLQLGCLAGLLGVAGASLWICSCCNRLSLATNIQATRVLAVLAAAVSFFLTLLFIIFLVFLRCPTRADNFCLRLHLALALTAGWHAFHGAVAGLVAFRATLVIRLLGPGVGDVAMVRRARTEPP